MTLTSRASLQRLPLRQETRALLLAAQVPQLAPQLQAQIKRQGLEVVGELGSDRLRIGKRGAIVVVCGKIQPDSPREIRAHVACRHVRCQVPKAARAHTRGLRTRANDCSIARGSDRLHAILPRGTRSLYIAACRKLTIDGATIESTIDGHPR
jgi:hypothetical protein